MIEQLQHQQQINSEMEKYKNKMEEDRKPFEFINVGFSVDMREAQKRYQEDWKGDVGGVKSSQISFSQWLDYKKYEAVQFYMKHSEFYLGF
ncbi:MAG: hypothetical protein AABY15_01525 [Nanoarchaeota archaeon]